MSNLEKPPVEFPSRAVAVELRPATPDTVHLADFDHGLDKIAAAHLRSLGPLSRDEWDKALTRFRTERI